jgi:diamine N-acetyltransferase
VHLVPRENRDVTLREITPANQLEVELLTVTTVQEAFVTDVATSLREAAATPAARPWFRAIYDGASPVGFVMISDNVPPGHPEFLGPYYLWRLLVDARLQRRGYGRAALDLTVAYLRTRPNADALLTSVAPGEGSPIDFYLHYGFRRTGAMFDHGHVLELRLPEGAPA